MVSKSFQQQQITEDKSSQIENSPYKQKVSFNKSGRGTELNTLKEVDYFDPYASADLESLNTLRRQN